MDKIATAVNSSPIIPIYREHYVRNADGPKLKRHRTKTKCLRVSNVTGLRYRCLRDINVTTYTDKK